MLSEVAPPDTAPIEGGGCHAGTDTLHAATALAGKSEILARYTADYPKSPHEQP